jgi:hypothetical protein
MNYDTSTHVLPVDDLKEHISNGLYCHCRPRVEEPTKGNFVVVHNAYDGREFDEVDEFGESSGTGH